MKKVYAINGSPRKNKNTATLLDKVLEGVKDAFEPGLVETERINLYDLQFTGCKSCFACKLKDGASYGKCAIKDDLQPVLEKLSEGDAVIFGSPIYFGTITGQLHAFYERLFYPYTTYKADYQTLVPKRMRTACIYTMNVTEEWMKNLGYRQNVGHFESLLENFFSKPETLFAFNTYQFNDYSKYVCEVFSADEKAAYRDKHFPEDCRKAYELGLSLLK